MGMVSILTKPFTTHPRQDEAFKKHPYRLQNLSICRPNQVWASDITYIHQGCQFTSDLFTGILEAEGIRISWDSQGRAVDYIGIERFWWTLKYEHVYLHEADTMWQAEKGIAKYIAWYNAERTHMSLKDRTPDSVYHTQLAALAA